MAKQVVNFGPFQEFFHQGVRVGNTIYLAGQVGIDDEGTVVADDVAGQVAQCYANVARILKDLGATMDDIVDETYFVTDVAGLGEHVEGIIAARSGAYGKDVPEVTQTLVEVSALWMPEYKVEIKCVAVVSEG